MDIAQLRLSQQRLSGNFYATPEEVVSWLGAVQAQDFQDAKWALGLRMQSTRDASIEQAFNQGAILRTHAMRPTWHFISPNDIGWIQMLTAPRVHAVNGTMYRRLELDLPLFSRSDEIIARALEGDRTLNRTELAHTLAEAGIPAQGFKLTYLVMHAELEGLICSGPRRGKQFTYALLSERAPQARRLPRDEALAELTRRYFTGHGPATLRDFTWWSGLSNADAKNGLSMTAASLDHTEMDGQTYWFQAGIPAPNSHDHPVILLPTYDEYLIGYAMFGRNRSGNQEAPAALIFDSTILHEGQIIGSWQRTIESKRVAIKFAPFNTTTPAQNEGLTEAAQRYGEFLGLPITLA